VTRSSVTAPSSTQVLVGKIVDVLPAGAKVRLVAYRETVDDAHTVALRVPYPVSDVVAVGSHGEFELALPSEAVLTPHLGPFPICEGGASHAMAVSLDIAVLAADGAALGHLVAASGPIQPYGKRPALIGGLLFTAATASIRDRCELLTYELALSPGVNAIYYASSNGVDVVARNGQLPVTLAWHFVARS